MSLALGGNENMSINDIGMLLFLIAGFAILIYRVQRIIVRNKKTPIKPQDKESVTLYYLNERILESPSFAVENAILEVGHMAELTYDSIKVSFQMVIENAINKMNLVDSKRTEISHLQELITEYLTEISNLSLTEKQRLVLNNLFYIIHDLKRSSNYAMDIVELANLKCEDNVAFSEEAQEEINKFMELSLKSVENAVLSIKEYNIEYVRKVVKYKDVLDNLEEELKEKYIERLSSKQCKAKASIIYLDMISNLERISDHAYHIAGYVRNEME